MRQVVSTTGKHQRMQVHVAQTSSWPQEGWLGFLYVCCGSRWGDQTRMRNRDERVIYNICTSTPQETARDSKVKKDKVPFRGQRRRDEGNGGQVDRHSWKGIRDKTSCAGYRCPIIHHSSQPKAECKPEVEDPERTRKKPMKTPEEVHTTRHYGNNMVDVVRPSQSIIYNYTEKLETGHLLNLRVSEVDSGGGKGD